MNCNIVYKFWDSALQLLMGYNCQKFYAGAPQQQEDAPILPAIWVTFAHLVSE